MVFGNANSITNLSIIHAFLELNTMRHGRAKATRKTLRFYELNAGIKPPYRIVVDGNFLVAAAQRKLLGCLHERLTKLLQGASLEMFSCRASLIELEALYKATKNHFFQEARQWGLDECTVLDDNYKSDDNPNENDSKQTENEARETILKLVSKNQFFFVATQDDDLGHILRTKLANVPIIKLSQTVFLLESPSLASKRAHLQQESSKQSAKGIMTTEEKELIETIKNNKRKAKEMEAPAKPGTRVKRKAKAPNPLSCKKKQSTGEEPIKPESKKKRIRRR